MMQFSYTYKIKNCRGQLGKITESDHVQKYNIEAKTAPIQDCDRVKRTTKYREHNKGFSTQEVKNHWGSQN